MLPLGTFPFHALQGLTLPLVVLGVIAWRSHLHDRPLPLLLALVVAFVLIVPARPTGSTTSARPWPWAASRTS